jgi:hypothetical protein
MSAEDWTAREASSPFVARVAADAVARHERRFHAEAPTPQTCPHCGGDIRIEDRQANREGNE